VLVGRGEEAGRRQRLAHGNKLQVVIHTDAGISIITLASSTFSTRLCISSHLRYLESKRKQIDTLTAPSQAR
jgi:hypothetical protein